MRKTLKVLLISNELEFATLTNSIQRICSGYAKKEYGEGNDRMGLN